VPRSGPRGNGRWARCSADASAAADSGTTRVEAAPRFTPPPPSHLNHIEGEGYCTVLKPLIQPGFCIGVVDQHLGEVNTIRCGHYERSRGARTKRGAAVEAKAKKAFTEYRTKARNADQIYNGTAAGAVGPIEERRGCPGVRLRRLRRNH
jgi:hypothetical protein